HQLAAVFLVGGSSRIPLVARLVHERTGIMPITLDQPETVVARGALSVVILDPLCTAGLSGGAVTQQFPMLCQLLPGHYPPPPVPGLLSGAGPSSARSWGDSPIGQQKPLGPPLAQESAGPPSRGRSGLWLGSVSTLALVAIVVGVLVLVYPGPSTQSVRPSAQAGPLISQYEYQFALPYHWQQSGADASHLEVQIAPSNALTGAEGIYVGENRLSYDAGADRSHAISELREKVQAAGYTNFDSQTTYAGRAVTYYRERTNDLTVEWYVLFQRTVQISIGCQYGPGSQATVQGPCQRVASGLIITN
ncbi:MAG: type VII secretion-associated protein, partial [Candidatus Dormibacteraceae bacterium]